MWEKKGTEIDNGCMCVVPLPYTSDKPPPGTTVLRMWRADVSGVANSILLQDEYPYQREYLYGHNIISIEAKCKTS